MAVTSELLIWIKWLRNYQSYNGKFSVPIAHELERVLGNALDNLQQMQAEIDILKANGGGSDARKDSV